MGAGDVVLVAVPQIGWGSAKLRPALILATLPGPYQSHLLCGISKQLRQQEPDWDELMNQSDSDFISSGLHAVSIIRLSYLYATDLSQITGAIGHIDPARLPRLRVRLRDHLST